MTTSRRAGAWSEVVGPGARVFDRRRSPRTVPGHKDLRDTCRPHRSTARSLPPSSRTTSASSKPGTSGPAHFTMPSTGRRSGPATSTRHPNQGAPCCLRGTPTAPVDSPPVRVRHAYGNRTSRSRLQPRSSDKRGLGVEEAQRSAPCGCPHVRMRRATYRRQMDRLRASDRWSDALNRVSARCRNKSRFRGTLSPNSGKTPRWS